MQKKTKIKLLLLLILIAVVPQAAGQFFYDGRGSATQKWHQIKADKYRLLYPSTYEPSAIRLSHFMDSIAPYIGYGMPNRLLRTPIILYTQDQLSNGMVVWAPKRDEMMVTPPVYMTATPWIKQLAIHEWRHVVQMSSLNTGLTKVGSWILGQAGLCVGLLVISEWQLEGDATNAETQFSEFGRGLQPEFTLQYRAMAERPNFLNLKTDVLIGGSYKKSIPDIYHYGYQVMRAAETYIKPTIWGEVFDYSAKYPIFIVPDHIYLKRHYKTSIRAITKRTFAELDSIWQKHETTQNNFLTATKPQKSYTTYENPLLLHHGNVLTLRKDFDTPLRFIAMDSMGKERKLWYTGSVTSRSTIQDSIIYWTEYKPHPIYEKKNFSVIASYDIGSRKYRNFHRYESHYFITPMGKRGFAAVANDDQACGYIKYFDTTLGEPIDEYHFDRPTSLHGLAWDELTQTLAFIAVDDDGMWIGGLDAMGGLRVLKERSAVTLSDLRAQDGTLYFGSIESGKDEVHARDIMTGSEHRLTTSRFGSGQPTVRDSTIYFRTYTADGWMLAKTTVDTTKSPNVEYTRLPKNILNPNRVAWEVPNADSITITNDSTTDHKMRRYTKFGRQFNVHSWAPVAIDFDRLLNDRQMRLGFGATAFFQSTLSDFYGSAAVGTAVGGKFWTVGSFTYTGLPVELTVRAEYGGGDQLVYIPMLFPGQTVPEMDSKPYFSITTNVAVPINLSGGHSVRLLEPQVSFTHYNANVFNPDQGTWDRGYQQWRASLWWSTSRIKAYRALYPRLGYALRAMASGTMDYRFSRIYSLWGRAYLPGVMANHSLILKAAGQYQTTHEFQFGSKVMTPRGVLDNYAARNYYAFSADYTFPIAYPDWGWDGVIYFKRIYANIFGDYSLGRYFTNQRGQFTNLSHYSFGVDLSVEFNLIRTFGQTVTFSFAFPEARELFFTLGYAVNF